MTAIKSKKKSPVRQRPAKKAPKKQAKKNYSFGQSHTRKASAPVYRTSLRSGTSFHFGAAPYEENFGEGLRMVGKSCTAGIGRNAAAAANRVLLINNGTNAMRYDAVAKSVLDKYSTTSGEFHSILGYDTAVETPIQTLGKLFSMYAVREMRIVYRPTVGTSTNGSLVLGVTRQAREILPEETTYAAIQSLPNSVATPLWKEVSLVVVKDKDLNKPVARLYDTQVNSSMSSGSYDVQFNIVAAVDQNIASSTDFLGFLDVEYVIDFYNMRGTRQTSTTVDSRREEKKEEKKEVKEDYILVTSESASGLVSKAAPSQLSSVQCAGPPGLLQNVTQQTRFRN